MMKKILFFLIILFLLTSCLPYQKPGTGPVIKTNYNLAINSSPSVNNTVFPDLVKDKPMANSEPIIYDKEVADLISKSKTVENYHYFFRSLIKTKPGVLEEKGGYDVYIKDYRVKKVYNSPISFDNQLYFDQVYLDIQNETAFGTCQSLSVICEDNYSSAYLINYFTEKLAFTPLQLIQNISSKAKKNGEEMIENRKAFLLEYPIENNKLGRLAVDVYYGIPVRFSVYSYKGDLEILDQEYTFSKLTANNIKSFDVTLPEGISLVENN